MPVRPDGPTSDPKNPTQSRGSLVGVVATSAMMVLLTMFSIGKLPAGDALLNSLNAALRQRNDQIVAAIVQYAPYALMVAGLSGVAFLLLNGARRPRRG